MNAPLTRSCLHGQSASSGANCRHCGGAPDAGIAARGVGGRFAGLRASVSRSIARGSHLEIIASGTDDSPNNLPVDRIAMLMDRDRGKSLLNGSLERRAS